MTYFLLRMLGGASGDEFGAALLSLVDLDGDGVDDLVVGAPGVDTAGADAGAVVVYFGATSGYLDTGAPTVLLGATAGDGFGRGLAAGDVDGDGLDELAVYGSGCECVSVLAGADGFATRTTIAGTTGTGFGSAMDLGDLQGDGFADLLVGAPGDDDAGTDAGAVFVYHGSSAGLGGTPDETLLGAAAYDQFGAAVISAGDVDGDGDTELAVGAPGVDPADAGNVYVWLGTAAGIASTADWSSGVGPGEGLGTDLVRADLNGDGYGDVAAVSIRTGFTGAYGSATGLGTAGPLLGSLGYLETAIVGPGADGDGDGVDSLLVQYTQSAVYTGCEHGSTMESSFGVDLDLPAATSLAAAGDVAPAATEEVWLGIADGTGQVLLAATLVDDDDDGYPVGLGSVLDDCDDADPDRHPLADETDGDGADSDCDGDDDAPVSSSPPACRSVSSLEAAKALLDADQRVATEVPGWIDAAEGALADEDDRFWVTVDDGAMVWTGGWMAADAATSGTALDFQWQTEFAYHDSKNRCVSVETTERWAPMVLSWPEGNADGLISISALHSGDDTSDRYVGSAAWADGTERVFATEIESGGYHDESSWSYDSYTFETLSEEADGCTFEYEHRDGVMDSGATLDGAYWSFDDGLHTALVVDGYSDLGCSADGLVVGRLDDGAWRSIDPDTWGPLDAPDADGDGWSGEHDCDDANPDAHPCAEETPGCPDLDCDRRAEDSDGDGTTDCADCAPFDPALPAEWFGGDDDGDGFGDESTGYACEAPADGGSLVVDCDDTNPLVSPEEIEECNTVDDDCDGDVDESSGSPRYHDDDGDGYGGTPYAPPVRCYQTSAVAGDCDDENAEIRPGAAEVPDDGVDQDCDGQDTVTEPVPEPEPEAPGCFDGCATLTGVAGLAGALRRRRG